MAYEKQDKMVHIIGNVGSAPEKKDTGKGVVVNIFTIVPLRYGDDKQDQPVNVGIWDRNPEIQDWAMENVSVGTPIAAMGWLKSRKLNNGKTALDLSVVRIGIVDFAKRNNSGQASKPKEEEPAESALGGMDW